MARTADLVLMMLDATKSDVQRQILEAELDAVGIRLNTRPPNIYFKLRPNGGGLSYTSTCKQSVMSEKLAASILHEYRIFHAEVVLREDIASVDDFIDAVLGNRIYARCLYCYNKVDQLSMEEVRKLGAQPNTVLISCEWNLGLEYLVERMWESLALSRIYTKKHGSRPDFSDPLIVRSGATLEHVCHVLHRDLPSIFKYSLIWGTSAKHQPQKVGLSHPVDDEDVVQIVKKK